MSKLRSFHDYVEMHTPDRHGWCSRCHKKLLVDIGIADDGIPGVWAFCRTCKTFYCPINFKHVLAQGSARWRPGRTLHGEARVGNCLIDGCGLHFEAMERAVTATMRYPRGPQTAVLIRQWRDRAPGADPWARQAQVILQLHKFKTAVEPQWIAEDAAADRAREDAARKVMAARQQAAALAKAEERAARQAAAKEAAPARWAAYVASGEIWSDSSSDERSIEELMAILDREL